MFFKLSWFKWQWRVETKCCKPHQKIPMVSKVIQVLKLCKFANKLRPFYCLDVTGSSVLFPITQISRLLLTLYLIETPFNTFANRADPGQTALIRAAWPGSTLFAYGNMTRYDPTQVDLKSNFPVLCTKVKVNLYNYSQWVEFSMNIHEGKG